MSNKQDATSSIIRFLTKSDIILHAEEEKILARWEKADFYQRQGMETSDIILKITHDFDVSKFTADNDIYSAQEVFGKSRKLNKKYLGHLHLQDITQDLNRIRKSLFKVDKDGTTSIPDEKEIMALAKLHDSYTRQLNIIPDENEHSDAQKPTIIFQLVGVADSVKMPMDVSQALLLADKFINNQAVEDIDHKLLQDNDSAD